VHQADEVAEVAPVDGHEYLELVDEDIDKDTIDYEGRNNFAHLDYIIILSTIFKFSGFALLLLF
jgi:hypothetical protein